MSFQIRLGLRDKREAVAGCFPRDYLGELSVNMAWGEFEGDGTFELGLAVGFFLL